MKPVESVPSYAGVRWWLNQERSERRIVKIESEVPFGRNIYSWLYLNNDQIESLIKHDQIETHYLAWETVRKEMNPFFEEGTGFEGYWVGRCGAADEALSAILDMSQHILDAIARYYRYEHIFRSQLMKTLTREQGDWKSILVWSDYLGAELGKLRAQILDCQAAQAFQQQTYTVVKTLPPMTFSLVGRDVRQTYAIGAESNIIPGKLIVTLPMLNASQQDAWLVAENIGQFGHPMVRKLLDRV